MHLCASVLPRKRTPIEFTGLRMLCIRGYICNSSYKWLFEVLVIFSLCMEQSNRIYRAHRVVPRHVNHTLLHLLVIYTQFPILSARPQVPPSSSVPAYFIRLFT